MANPTGWKTADTRIRSTAVTIDPCDCGNCDDCPQARTQAQIHSTHNVLRVIGEALAMTESARIRAYGTEWAETFSHIAAQCASNVRTMCECAES